MSNNKLLPQDIFLLCTKWADPEHVPVDESLGPQAWRAQYKRRLERTIAIWLTKCLISYQYSSKRMDAFAPIAHLVGASRHSMSYLDSLIMIAEELAHVKDPQYRAHPKEAFLELDFVFLGECFSNATAKAAEILAERLGEDEFHQAQCFQALVDVLVLIQAVKPQRTAPALYASWKILHSGKSKSVFDQFTKDHPWVIEHGFVLALYPICDIGASKQEVEGVLKDLSDLVLSKNTPAILRSDFEACWAMISPDIPATTRRMSFAPMPKPDLQKYPETSAIRSLPSAYLITSIHHSPRSDYDQQASNF